MEDKNNDKIYELFKEFISVLKDRLDYDRDVLGELKSIVSKQEIANNDLQDIKTALTNNTMSKALLSLIKFLVIALLLLAGVEVGNLIGLF